MISRYLSSRWIGGGVVVLSASSLLWPGAIVPTWAQAASTQGRRWSAVTAFVDVAVVPMDRTRVLPHQTVVVRGEHIVALGPTSKITIPAGAQRVDGREKYLLPGLADIHVHLPNLSFAGPEAVRQRLMFLLRQGVTTARDMGSDPGTLLVRDSVARGAWLGPRLYTATPLCLPAEPLARCVPRLKAAGYDYFKAKEPTRAELDTLIPVARRVGLPVVGHAPLFRDGGLEAAFRVPYQAVEHFTGMFSYVVGKGLESQDSTLFDSTEAWLQPNARPDPARLRALAAASRRAGTWYTPTLAAIWHMGRIPVQDTATEQLIWRQMGAWRPLLVKALHDEGAGLLLGTDWQSSDEPMEYRELQKFLESGLTPYQALETATRNVAEHLGTLATTGTIAVGKQADLVLLDGNPLKDIGHVRRPAGVMARGRWLTRDELEAGVAEPQAAGAEP